MMVGMLWQKGNVEVVYVSGEALLVFLRELDVKPGDLTIAGQQQVDNLAKAAVERRFQKMADWLPAGDHLRIFMSSKEPSLN